MWTMVVLNVSFPKNMGTPLFWAICFSLLLPAALWWQHHVYQHHTRMVLFLLDALENNDHSMRFNETEENEERRMVHKALNRVSNVLLQARLETIEQEKYYELILDFVNTGVLVLNEKGVITQKNKEALRLLGLDIFTHINQLENIDADLMKLLQNCRAGDKLQYSYYNERKNVQLSINVSLVKVHNEPLRIIALNDIHTALDEKEIDSWMRLTRVLTHEIMNSVTPITSLSDTLLSIITKENAPEEVRKGLQTIHATGNGLLSFVNSYRKFTYIPTPKPTLFYLKPFIERTISLIQAEECAKYIHFNLHINPDELILYADEQLITQVMLNLLKNARQAIEECEDLKEGIITLRAYCDDEEAVIIEVSNNGKEIPTDIQEHIFVPFFTTKQTGNGIGLSISRQIMRLSQGSISLLSGNPTTFRLVFN